MDKDITTFLDDRRTQLERAIGRALGPVPSSTAAPLTETKRNFLREEAEELYWNELEWENITEEERLDDGAIAELTFPGFLAFVRGLLLKEALPEAGVQATPRPEVVEDVLAFLSQRLLDLSNDAEPGDADDAARARTERTLTSNLVDLVLLRLHGVDPADV